MTRVFLPLQEKARLLTRDSSHDSDSPIPHGRLLILVPSTDASNDGSEDNNPGGDGMSDCGSVNLKASSSTAEPGMNCIRIGLPGKLILRKRKGLREVIFS